MPPHFQPTVPLMQDFRALIQGDLDAVNALIVSKLKSDVTLVENIGHYIVDSGGKRLRPVLALLSARCLGCRGEAHIAFAAAVEFIHTATLLHDDVVDIASLRRGKPTANAEFGNAPSVLVGDFLYTRAFQLLVEIGNLEVMRDMADTTNLIAEGEVLQLVCAGDPEAAESRYLEIVSRKTAVLFASACFAAAPLAGKPELGEHLRDYGHNIGIAFQIIDDVLDYAGQTEQTGKNPGGDLAEGKTTLPLIHVLKHGNAAERKLVAAAIREKDSAALGGVLNAVERCGALDYARSRAGAYRDLALAALADLPDNPYRRGLQEVAESAVRREA